MADGNGASVGTISLSLIIDAELNKQLSALQKSMQSQWDKVGETAEKALTDSVEKAADKAVKPVEEVGKAIEKTVTQSVEKAVQKVEKPVEEVGKTLESSISENAEKASETLEKALVEPAKEAKKEAENLSKAINNKHEFAPGYNKEAMDFVNSYQPKSSDKPEAPQIDVGSFEISADPIDRLNKSLELTTEKIELAQEKWKQLHLEMAAMSDEDMAGDKGNAIIGKINTVETSLLKLQQQAEATKAKIDKAIEPPPALDKTATKVGKLADSVSSSAKKVESSVNNSVIKPVKKIGTTAQTSFGKARTSANGFGKALGGIGKSVKSALKSTFLMAGLYAVFRGVKTVIENATSANKEFDASVKQIKGNLQVAFTPIINAIMPALNMLASGLATATKAVASFMSGLFGTTYKQSLKATKQIEAAGAAAKKNSRFLANFDEMNVASDNSSDSNGSAANLAALDSEGNKTAENIGNKIREQIGKGFEYLKGKLSDAKSYFDTNFAPVFAEIGAKFLPVIEGFKSNMGKAWSDMATLAEPFKNYITDNLTPALQTAFENVGTVASGLGDTLNIVFGKLWDKVIFPTLKKMTSTVLPLLTDQWAEMTGVMTTTFNTIKPLFDKVFTTGIIPILKTLQGIWSDLWDTSAKVWDKYGKPTMEAIKSIITSVGDTVMKVYKSWIQPVVKWVCDSLKSMWDRAIKPIYEKIAAVISKIIQCINTVWVNFLKPCVDWIVKTAGPLISNALNAIKNVFDTVFSFIGTVVGTALDTFGGLLDFITGVFSGDWNKAWNGIKDTVKAVWDGIWGTIKSIINLIIDGINLLWTGIYNAVKGLVDAVGGVAGVIGDILGQDWHFSMPDSPPLIPKLAKGGLAYAPTLAMVGDNRNAGTDPEVIAPLSKLKDIIGEGGDMTEVVLLLREILEFLKGLNLIAKGEVDGKTLYRLIVQLNKENTYRTGVNALG